MASENFNVAAPYAAFRAAITGLVVAGSPTDIFTIAGVTGRSIKLNEIIISGIAGTAIAVPVTIIKRTAANTGGTSTPVTPVAMSSAQPQPSASGATILAYTANPSGLGATTAPNGGVISASRLILSTSAASVGSSPFIIPFEKMYAGMPELLSPNDLIGINFNGSSVSGGNVDISIIYTERNL